MTVIIRLLLNYTIFCNDDKLFLITGETEEIFRLLLQRERDLIKQQDDNGNSAFHLWAYDRKLWPFKSLLESNDIIPDAKRVFADLVSSTNNDGINPLHFLVKRTSNEEVSIEIAKLLVEIYKQELLAQTSSISEDQLPWLKQDDEGNTPFSLAIDRQLQNLAKYILSVDVNVVITCQENVLFLAIEKGCHEVAEKILEIVVNKGWTQLLTTSNNHQNILHLAALCKGESTYFCFFFHLGLS